MSFDRFQLKISKPRDLKVGSHLNVFNGLQSSNLLCNFRNMQFQKEDSVNTFSKLGLSKGLNNAIEQIDSELFAR